MVGTTKVPLYGAPRAGTPRLIYVRRFREWRYDAHHGWLPVCDIVPVAIY